MRLPDHIIADSPHTADRLRETLGTQASITIAPLGVDLEAVRGSYPDHATTDLVVVGRLMAHKRIDMLLDAVALLHAEGMPVTCRIIGDGPERERLRHQAQTLGLEQAVDFRHNVGEQKEVYALIKAAKVFVFPSAREGFGIAVLEAMACGVPVVTTSAPDNLAQHLVVRSPHGTVCDPTAPAIAEAVRIVLTDHSSLASAELGDDDSWLADYDWDVMTDLVARALQI